MEKKKYELAKVQLATIKLPQMQESFNRTPWVNYGEDNLYPQYLIHQYNNSAIHKAVISAKRELTCGDGLVCLQEPLAIVNTVNGKETVEEVFRKAEDYMYKRNLFESSCMRGKTVNTIINTLNEKNKRALRRGFDFYLIFL